MVNPKQALSDTDVARIAALHVESIEDSLPTLLGAGFARALYRYLERSAEEILFVERIDGRVESACVVSLEPGSLHGRIARATLPLLVWHAAIAVFTKRAFRAMLWHTAAEAVGGASHADRAPEIAYVFTSQAARGKKLGRQLIERVDTELLARGFERYFVKTIDDAANRAVSFYSENGFELLGPRIQGGRPFVEFKKPLSSP